MQLPVSVFGQNETEATRARSPHVPCAPSGATAVECLWGAWGGQSVPMAAQGDPIGGVGCLAPSPWLAVNLLGCAHPVLKVGMQQPQRGPQISSLSPCCCARPREERRP